MASSTSRSNTPSGSPRLVSNLRPAASGTATTMPLRGLLATSPLAIGSKASWPLMAETVIGRYKTEVINRRGPWQTLQAVELATLALGLLLKAAAPLSGLLRCCSQGVDWFNNRRLLQPIGNIPPAEAEAAFYDALKTKPMAPLDPNQPDSGKPGAVQLSGSSSTRSGRDTRYGTGRTSRVGTGRHRAPRERPLPSGGNRFRVRGRFAATVRTRLLSRHE